METSLYRSDIQDIIKNVDSIDSGNAKEKIELCDKLIEYADSRRESALLGFSYYKKAYCFYLLNDIPSFYLSILKCMKPLEYIREWEYLAYASNLFGVLSVNRGNVGQALDYFYKAKDYATEYELGQIMCHTDINLGNLFLMAKDPDNAIKHFELAKKYLDNHTDMTGYVDKLAAVFTGCGKAHLALGNIEEAKTMKANLGKQCIAHLKGAPLFSVNCFAARLHHSAGEMEEHGKFIQVISAGINSTIPIMDIFEDVYELLSMLKEEKLEEAFYKIYDPVLLAVKDTTIKNLEKRLLALKYSLLKELGKTDEAKEIAMTLAEVLETMDTENSLLLANAIAHQENLDVLREENRNIKKEKDEAEARLEKDFISGLDNRIKLRGLAEEIFNRSVLNKVGFAAEYLDVDFSKIYADKYGRYEGDKCILSIGDVIREVLKEHNGVYAFAVGSDEFVLLYEGYAEQDAFDTAKELKNAVLEKKIPNEDLEGDLKQITISQGLYWGLPSETDSVWEYLAEAEKLLGKVKKKSKNSTMLGKHKPTEEGAVKKLEFKKPFIYQLDMD